MFICSPQPFHKRIQRFLRKKWDWNVLLGNVLGIGGLVASVWGGFTGMPWHLSGVLFFMVCFQSYYCSRYYRLKHTRYHPKAGYENLHDFAESLRKLSASQHFKCLEKGYSERLSSEQLDRLIDEHRNFAHVMCKSVRDVLLGHGIKIQRVCVKLHVRDMLIRVANHEGPAPNRLDTTLVTSQLFWKMLSNVHFHYDKWIHKEGIKSLPENMNLKARPRFLAIEGLRSSLAPKIMESLTNVVTREQPTPEDAAPPNENHVVAKDMWEQLRRAIDNRYENCIGLMISGPTFVDPFTPSPSPTHLIIGFIGIDSENSDALHMLEQSDLHGVAAIADAAYVPLTTLRTLYELRLHLLNSAAT
jgi:hypothetical protein